MTLGDVQYYAKNIKHFRGVFMRDALPDKSNHTECGVINLDSILNRRTHWTAYFKRGDRAVYFDSYGSANPPLELVKYLNVKHLQYNTDSIQTSEDAPICGHLCLEFLRLIQNNNWKYISRVIKDNVLTSWI